MRKLSMKGKRKQSESGSESDSGENGVSVKPPSDEDASPLHEASKIQKKKKKGRRSNIDKDVEPNTLEPEENEQENGSPAKKRKKDAAQKPSTSEDKSSESEYEVQKVVGQRTIKGRRQFLVRWKGYDEDADTWEQEKNLNCPQLIEEYLAEVAETSNNEKSTKTAKSPKTQRTAGQRKGPVTKQSAKTPPSTEKSKSVTPAVSEDDEENTKLDHENTSEEDAKEFEVERIIDVRFHKKTKTRDFLIRWKGFSPAEDSWEPEKNLNCPELILRFMEKVEVAKKSDPKELRTNPAHTKRYTLMSNDSGRRLSRRNTNRQRATYHQCDE